MKTCTKCGGEKRVTEFSADSRNRDGLQSWCKSCAKTAKAKWRATNLSKVRAYDAEWEASNPDKVREIAAKCYAANSEKVKIAVAKWAAKNPEAVRVHHQNRRASKFKNGGQLSKGLAEKLFRLQRGKCACCKQPLGDDYHMDHVMPLVLGGSNTDDNMQLLRKTCNLQKNRKHPVEFMRQRGFLI